MSTIPLLVFTDNPDARALPVDKDSITIGRLPGHDLVLPDRCVSRRHATIERVSGAYELFDHNSSQGTWVNGERIQHTILRDGDILQFGSPAAAAIRFKVDSANTNTGNSVWLDNAEDLLSAVHIMSRNQNEESSAAREMGQLNFLLSAARRLNAGGAKDDILRALLQLSIQLTNVERGFVFLREGGEMRLALGLRSDGTSVLEDSTVSRRAMQRAIESTTRFSVSDTLSDIEAGGWASVVANSIRCIYCIPLRKRVSGTEPEHLLGLLYLDSQLNIGKLSEIDHEVLDTVANEAATLLDNALLAEAELQARRAAEELNIAARIHASLMSTALPRVPYAQIDARTLPCLAIGGDFYDAIELEDSLGVVIADVSGKGVPASIVAATLQGIVHAQMLAGQSLEQIATSANRFLCARSIGKYATLVLLKVHRDGRTEYLNCGHIRPLLVNAGGVQVLEESNLMVGLICGATYTTSTCTLTPGDRILLATDGVTEAENPAQEQFGDQRFESAAATEDIEGVLRRVMAFQQNHPAQDDCTLIQVRYLAEPAQ